MRFTDEIDAISEYNALNTLARMINEFGTNLHMTAVSAGAEQWFSVPNNAQVRPLIKHITTSFMEGNYSVDGDTHQRVFKASSPANAVDSRLPVLEIYWKKGEGKFVIRQECVFKVTGHRCEIR